jgi:hypothetical protein
MTGESSEMRTIWLSIVHASEATHAVQEVDRVHPIDAEQEHVLDAGPWACAAAVPIPLTIPAPLPVPVPLSVLVSLPVTLRPSHRRGQNHRNRHDTNGFPSHLQLSSLCFLGM